MIDMDMKAEWHYARHLWKNEKWTAGRIMKNLNSAQDVTSTKKQLINKWLIRGKKQTEKKKNWPYFDLWLQCWPSFKNK